MIQRNTLVRLFWNRQTTGACSRSFRMEGNLAIIGSDNGLSPGWRQAIIWTNAGILLTGPLETNFSEILIKSHTFHSQKCLWKSCLQNGGHFVLTSMWYIYTFMFPLKKSMARCKSMATPTKCSYHSFCAEPSQWSKYFKSFLYKSMTKCKIEVTPLLIHYSYLH